jgi:hypothetical protein
MWTAWLDGCDTPFMEGTEDEVRAVVKAEPQEHYPYAEDPDGNQFAWNPHLNRWDEL